MELLTHLQHLCVGIHALDVLALQNEIQQYHQEMEGIPEYVNALKDAQKRCKRTGNSIMEDTLLLIATNAMLSTDSFPQADEIWYDIPKNRKNWLDWKICTRQLTGMPRSRSNPLEVKTNLAPFMAHLGRRLKSKRINKMFQ